MNMLNTLQLAVVHAWSTDGPGEWWWLWRIAMFLIWIVVLFFIFRWLGRGRYRQPDPMERARGILAERYARGEIDAAEYRQRSETLQ